MDPRTRVRERWQAPAAGERYAGERWRSPVRRERDPRLVDALLAAHLPRRDGLRVLDAPCGAGRLGRTLGRRGRLAGLDASRPMLDAARAELGAEAALLLGSVGELPFRDDTFDAVVCCRLLHHYADARELDRALAELVRVSRDLVVASFWDARALPALRRALLPGARAPRRIARTRGELASAIARAGADVIGWKHSFRFVSRQTFFVARKRSRARGP